MLYLFLNDFLVENMTLFIRKYENKPNWGTWNEIQALIWIHGPSLNKEIIYKKISPQQLSSKSVWKKNYEQKNIFSTNKIFEKISSSYDLLIVHRYMHTE